MYVYVYPSVFRRPTYYYYFMYNTYLYALCVCSAQRVRRDILSPALYTYRYACIYVYFFLLILLGFFFYNKYHYRSTTGRMCVHICVRVRGNNIPVPCLPRQRREFFCKKIKTSFAVHAYRYDVVLYILQRAQAVQKARNYRTHRICRKYYAMSS